MIKKGLLSIFLFSLLTNTLAQPSTGYRGNATTPTIFGFLIEDSTNEPVEFATVSVFSKKDSSLTTGSLTDSKGYFTIDTKPGSYYLIIQFMGYRDLIVDNIKLGRENKTFNAGRLRFKQNEQVLEEVIVQGERTQMELTLDKKVFNIGQDLSNLGGSATDILDNLPSVQVDIEGNVSLRGSENVRILIDGKPSGLVGLSSNDALRQLNGNLIERVEIITNPSARYDAEGLAGIINIILKKEKKKGINGSFQANTGIPANNGGSVNMNFRRDRINFFTNFGINYRSNPGSGASYQEFGDPVTQITDRSREHNRTGINYNYRLGADIFLNDKNSLTLAFLYRFSDEENLYNLRYEDSFVSIMDDSLTLRTDNEEEDDENLEYTINYTKNFRRKGQKLTAAIQYQNNNEQERNSLVESNGLNEQNQESYLLQRALNDQLEERLMLQSDYIRPYAKDGKIEAGFRYTDRLVGNKYVVENQTKDGEYQVDSAFSNDFEYDEEVFAIYGIVSNKYKKISWQAGLRYEHTHLFTNQKTKDTANLQRYGNLFPSIFFTYQLTEDQAIQVSYSKRISRPRGRFLNPFSSISDNRNFWIGNPNLRPEYTDSYELGYLVNAKSSSIYAGFYYRYTQGVFQRLRFTEDQTTITRPYNVAEENAYGIEVNISREVNKWYRLNANFNFFNSFIPDGEVTFDEDVIRYNEARATSLTTRISNNLKINRLFNIQVNTTYRAPRKTVQGKRLSVTIVDLGFSKDILKGNGTLALSIRDLFNSRVWRSETFNEGFYQKSSFQWVSRTAQFTFTYRLNQKKQRGGGNRGDYGSGGGGANF